MKDNATSNKVPSIQSLSPITAKCDHVKEISIYGTIFILIEGAHTSKFQMETYKNNFNGKLTHLDPELHNIFSLNSINTKPVKGLFLS